MHSVTSISAHLLPVEIGGDSSGQKALQWFAKGSTFEEGRHVRGYGRTAAGQHNLPPNRLILNRINIFLPANPPSLNMTLKRPGSPADKKPAKHPKDERMRAIEVSSKRLPC